MSQSVLTLPPHAPTPSTPTTSNSFRVPEAQDLILSTAKANKVDRERLAWIDDL